MSSLSTQTEMSNRAYENALQNYYAGLAEGPGRDLDKEMRDQQSNELLDAFTAPIGAHFIDSGLENVKDYVNSGVKKAVQRGVDLGKAGAKKAVRAAAEKAGISEETVDDLLSGKMDAVKTVGQALDYIKSKAAEAGAEAAARARGASGQITDAVRDAGNQAAQAAAQARGGAEGALDEGGDLLDQITARAAARDILPATLGAPPVPPTAAQLADIGAVEPPRVLEPGDVGYDPTSFVPDPDNLVPESAFREGAAPRSAFAALQAQLPAEEGESGPSVFAQLQSQLPSEEGRKEATSFFGRLFGAAKPVNPQADRPLYLQEPAELNATFNDAFTGKEIDLTPKFQVPDGWTVEPVEGADDFLTGARDTAQKLVNRPGARGLERFRVLSGLGEDGINGRRQVTAQGENVEKSIKNLDGIFAYQRDVERQAQELGSELGRFQPVIQPKSNLARATASVDDIASDLAERNARTLAPAHRVLADVLKGATTGEPKTAAALPQITPEAIGKPIDTLPDLPDITVQALRNESGPVTEAKNPTSEADEIFDYGLPAVPDDRPPYVPPPSPAPAPEDDPEINVINPFDDEDVQKKINEGFNEGEAGDDPLGISEEDAGKLFGDDDPEDTDVVQPDQPKPDAAEAPKAEKPDLGKVIEGDLEKEAPEEELGADFGPVGDLVDLGLAAGTILGAVFGQKHEAPAPMPNLSNPAAPIGI